MSPTCTLLDRDLLEITGCEALAGVDEAGRGAFAGPVYAGCVLLTPSFYSSDWCKHNAHRINDSKQLSPDLRESLFEEINTLASSSILTFGIGVGVVEEIARYNILGATRLAMQRALERAAAAANYRLPAGQSSLQQELFSIIQESGTPSTLRVLVDGRPLKPFPYLHTPIVKGDSSSLAIAMASIIAKVARDRFMLQLHEAYPHYAFADHKGYGTPAHQDAIRKHGPCAEHRMLFLRKLASGK